jgi:hypothetical protein
LVEFSDGFLFSFGLNSIEFDLTLGTSLETTDLSSEFLVFVEVGSECSGEVVKFGLVLLSDFGQSDTGGILLVN